MIPDLRNGAKLRRGKEAPRAESGTRPEVSSELSKLPDSKASYREGGQPPPEPYTRAHISGEQQDKLARERSLIRQLETNLQKREEALRQKQARTREGPEGGANGGWELKGAAMGPYLWTDNSQLQADQDCQAWEGNWRRARYTAGSKSMARSGGTMMKRGSGQTRLRIPGWRSLARGTYTGEKGVGRPPW